MNNTWISRETVVKWMRQAQRDAEAHGVEKLSEDELRGACEQIEEMVMARAMYELIVTGKVEVRYDNDQMQIRSRETQ